MFELFPYSVPPDGTVIHASSLVDTLDFKPKQYPLPIPYSANEDPLFHQKSSRKVISFL